MTVHALATLARSLKPGFSYHRAIEHKVSRQESAPSLRVVPCGGRRGSPSLADVVVVPDVLMSDKLWCRFINLGLYRGIPRHNRARLSFCFNSAPMRQRRSFSRLSPGPPKRDRAFFLFPRLPRLPSAQMTTSGFASSRRDPSLDQRPGGSNDACQSACKFDPSSASNFDPFGRRGLAVARASCISSMSSHQK